MNNEIVAEKLLLLSQLHEMDEEPWRARAYSRASETVRQLEGDVGTVALRDLPGIGASIAQKIQEILATGSCKDLDDRLVPDLGGIKSMTAVDGVGLRTAFKLYQAHGVCDFAQLVQAAKEGRLSAKLTASVLACAERQSKRVARADATPIIERMMQEIRTALGESTRIEAAGSYRRGAPTIGDVDLLIELDDSATVLRETAKLFGLPLSAGHSKVTIRLSGLPCNADWRVIAPASWGAALCYFTGSKEHNIAMRQKARSLGLLLNEYGVWNGTTRIAGETEESVYAALGVAYRKPVDRNVSTV